MKKEIEFKLNIAYHLQIKHKQTRFIGKHFRFFIKKQANKFFVQDIQSGAIIHMSNTMPKILDMADLELEKFLHMPHNDKFKMNIDPKNKSGIWFRWVARDWKVSIWDCKG